MLSKIYARTSLLSPQTYFGGVAVGSLALLLVALAAQHLGGLAPCNECVYIRIAIAGAFLLSLAGFALKRVPALQVLAGLGGLAALGWGLSRAALLVALEQRVAAGEMVGCKRFMGFPQWAPLDSWMPFLFSPGGKCGEVAVWWFGVSFAQWTYWALAGGLVIATGSALCVSAVARREG